MEKIPKSTISIFRHTFDRLKEQANPAEIERADTMDAVINRALDALVEMSREVNDTLEGPGEMPREERRIDPEALPDLKHTELFDAAIDGEEIVDPYWNGWNGLLRRMIVRSKGEHSAFEAFRKRPRIQIFSGRKEDNAWTYLPEVDLSVRGVSANNACKAIVASARHLGIGLDIGFEWRDKADPAYAGQRGRIPVPANPEPGDRSNPAGSSPLPTTSAGGETTENQTPAPPPDPDDGRSPRVPPGSRIPRNHIVR